MTQKRLAREILNKLKKHYTTTREDFVLYKNPLELLVATILSAQCTDKQVNLVTKTLFKKYKTAKDYAKADIKELEKEIRSTGFYKNKARHLKGLGQVIVEKHNGKVPQTFKELLELPGVGKKTAYLTLARGFKKYQGIAVDTHVKRLAPRMGLTKSDKADKISEDLSKLYPPKEYLNVNEFFIIHGRTICKSKPNCKKCFLNNICAYGKRLLKQ